MVRPRRATELIEELVDGLEVVDDDSPPDPKVLALLDKLENIENADQCREVIATAARYRIGKLISGPEEKTFREAALGALKAIEVSSRTGSGNALTAAAEALVSMAEAEDEERAKKRKRRNKKEAKDG